MNEYTHLWRNKWLTAEATTIEEMISTLREAAEDLQQMVVEAFGFPQASLK